MSLIQQSGIFGYPLILLAIVNVALFIRAAMRLSNWRPENAPATTNGINAILFWGALSAILGLLGQSSGLYKALSVIAQAQAISPNLVAQGFSESFSTTIIGLTTLVLSAVAWFALNAWQRRVATPRG